MNKNLKIALPLCVLPALIVYAAIFNANDITIDRCIDIVTGLLVASVVALLISTINTHKEDEVEDFENYQANLFSFVFSVFVLLSSVILEISGAHLTSNVGIWVRIILIAISVICACYSAHLYIKGSEVHNNEIDELVSIKLAERERFITEELTIKMLRNYEEEISEIKSQRDAAKAENKHLTSIIESNGQSEIIGKIEKLKVSVDKLADNKNYKAV